MKVLQSERHYVLILIPIGIFLIGLFFIFSASWRDGRPIDESLVFRQTVWMSLAIVLTLISLRFHYRYLQEVVWPFYGFVIVCLIAVLFMPSRMGAHRWMDLGPINFQPSELAKFAIILTLAAYLKEHRFRHATLGEILVPFILVAFPFFLILKEPDLGTGLLFLPVLLGMLLVWGFKLKWLALMLTGALIVSPFLYQSLADYQKSRLMVFLNPGEDPQGAGYTIIQSKIAIGSGGLLGKGFMSGSQTQLRFLPEKYTDFIFSVIGEEGGFIALIIVILGYWMIVYKGYMIAHNCKNAFGKYLATGITTLLAFQALINMAMTIGLAPVVGMPLLLVSYGGSSLIVTMLLIGVLINIGMRRDPFL